jgi:hypothetical protein
VKHLSVEDGGNHDKQLYAIARGSGDWSWNGGR